MGKTTAEFNFYSNAVKTIQNETGGVLINWQKIMAIDAVLLEQDFSKSSEGRAYSYKKYFIREEQVKVEQTCSAMDANGNTVSFDCSYYRTVYYERDFDQVLQMLVADGKLGADKIEDVKRYMTYDASAFKDVGGGETMPPGWMPSTKDFVWPVPNVFTITSRFGPRVDPIEFTSKVHTGLDIGAKEGTQIVAVKEGKVTYAKMMGTAGNTVIIQHASNVETRYYHMSKISVKAGQEVKANDVVGAVGTTGNSTGPHLHLEVRIGGTPVDPLPYFQ
ncbi:M23 family metallopeptidase [Paenibacillus tyrfis]|uniref:M23 family metallopeptidase n=1 Tax=Paenibacillus tyrfis TaxID=1501230 RepID=UPI00209EF3AA|nr:M23 family metallopeptidase [Paenibacillus tyrfis]MCP1312090.1 M23 family metallopeptidase [Paenibacillus tyrfis]